MLVSYLYHGKGMFTSGYKAPQVSISLCVFKYKWVPVYACTCICGGQKTTFGSCFSGAIYPCFLRQSPALEFINEACVAGQHRPGICLPLLPLGLDDKCTATKIAFFTLFGSGEWTQVPCLHEKQFTVSLKFPLLKGAKQNPKRIIANISLQSMPGTTLTTGARARVQLSGRVLRSIHGVLGSTTSTKGRKQKPTMPLVISWLKFLRCCDEEQLVLSTQWRNCGVGTEHDLAESHWVTSDAEMTWL